MTARMDPRDRAAFAEAITRVTRSSYDDGPDRALPRIGWYDALRDCPADATSLLFEAQGRACATSAALDAVLATALGLEDPARSAVVLPAFGNARAPGVRNGSAIVARGLALARVASAREVVLVVADHDGHRAIAVDAGALRITPVGGIDPPLGLHHVEATLPGTTPATAADWEAALAAGRRALAHELIGLSRAMLEMARDHALTRQQGGRPIASFQALRHRLAESLVAIEAAEAAASAAWDSPGPLSASIAKALAGEAARTTARHAQQVLAGMGFTAEHAFHRYLKRALVLDQLLGSARRLTEELGRRLLAEQRLPPMLPL